MRIGIDVTCWANARGYGRFTRGLLSAVFAMQHQHDVVLFTDTQSYAHSDLPANIPCVVVPTAHGATEAASADGRRSLRDLWAMSNAVARRPLDVLFFPSVYTYFPAPPSLTTILGVHDVIAEDFPTVIFPNPRQRSLWTLKSWLAHRQADYILTVSEHAKQGILRHFGHAPADVCVVDEAPDPVFRRLARTEINSAVLARYGVSPGDRFAMYLGGVNPHKNLASLLASLAAVRQQSSFADVRLLIVGDFQNDVFTPGYNHIQQTVNDLGLGDAATFTGFVPDDEVVHLLNAATVLVLPSLAEGFGLPAVEAAACGTPVIATTNSPLPSLLAGGGVFIDPHEPTQLTRALEQLLGDDDQRHHMAEIAYQRASQLTWQRSASQFVHFLDTIAQER